MRRKIGWKYWYTTFELHEINLQINRARLQGFTVGCVIATAIAVIGVHL